MAYPLNAIASLLVLRKSGVPRSEQGALTAVAAFTPGVLGLAAPFIAANNAKGQGGLFGVRRLRHVQSTPAPAPASPHLVAVPDVIGETWDDAVSMLGDWDLKAARTLVYSDEADGTVVFQSPVSGRAVSLHSQVTLGVSQKGPPPEPETPYSERAELKLIESKVDRIADAVAKLSPASSRSQAPPAPVAPAVTPGTPPADGGTGKPKS